MAVLSGARDVAELSPAINVNNSILLQHGVKLRRRQLSLIAAAPNVGKSLVARNIVVHSEAETLYFSADSDEWTVMQSVLGALTHMKLDDIEQALDNPSPQSAEFFQRKLLAVKHVDWALSDGDLDMDFITQRVYAHEAVWDALPEMIVIDNVLDAVDDEDAKEVRRFCKQLRKLARQTEAHVVGLHHVMGNKEDGDKPIWLSDLLGKIGKVPEVVLGLSQAAEGRLLVTVAKNRGGRRGFGFSLPIDYSTGFVGGFSAN